MTAGLLVFDENGALQVDDTYAALSLIGKGSATFVQQPDPAHSGLTPLREQKATITVSGATNPVIALKSNYLCTLISRTNNGGGNWTFEVDGETAASGNALDYFVFDIRPQMTSRVGFWVWDGAGNLTLSSDTPPARVTAAMINADSGELFRQANGQVDPNAADFSYGAGRDFAVIQGRVANYRLMEDNSFGQDSLGSFRCIKSVSGGIHLENKALYGYTFTNSAYDTFGYHTQIYDLLVVDVTNY